MTKNSVTKCANFLKIRKLSKPNIDTLNNYFSLFISHYLFLAALNFGVFRYNAFNTTEKVSSHRIYQTFKKIISITCTTMIIMIVYFVDIYVLRHGCHEYYCNHCWYVLLMITRTFMLHTLELWWRNSQKGASGISSRVRFLPLC